MHKTVNATPERLAKGDVTEVYVQEHQNLPPQKRLRSSGALYALRRAGTITDAHVAAAEHWARDYETGVLGARDPEAALACRITRPAFPMAKCCNGDRTSRCRGR
ncbi:hypothetical protein NKW44_14710 [Acetobacter lovaniensis]|uniref:hypothetical protein n=1 Tax=Acetobacter lovaniensis TaxID=104100 RepID=UPI00209DDD1C|nr:hypothetical protein [Acetobacter lovaniensis]MCI1796583.1 hypothetical protein [Acetobacter lovaniensis]MCP1240911.1 hypothetical protein [Acetobacter lovaniensis]